jgi:hypothetical protein
LSEKDWTDEENDLIVEDYFDMLTQDLAVQPYVKSGHRRKLQAKLNRRSEGSIEFKHQNISAVMLGLGQPRIEGYKPARRFQMSLVDAVLRKLETSHDWSRAIELRKQQIVRPYPDFSESEQLRFGPPPTHSNLPPPIDADLMAAIARKFDVAERDERNRELGKAGERLILDFEKSKLRSLNKPALAEKVRWTSREIGDGAGFDIESFDEHGNAMFIEVKTTNGWERTPFHISRNELTVADENRDSWHLYRIWNFARKPEAFSIRPPLQSHVALTPTSFLASLL